jgi:hypothetical protein
VEICLQVRSVFWFSKQYKIPLNGKSNFFAGNCIYSYYCHRSFLPWNCFKKPKYVYAVLMNDDRGLMYQVNIFYYVKNLRNPDQAGLR